ncbi:FecR family protein [Chondromyces apiculatus]|uniref:FecR protein domain-containing protein n=1 Tax=Chondromyces apiculatus DSM 436 TaxID=1192034 RepID=A0A017T7R4_9BACT|nr:FecR family protein [Chondromyces apiculatus]EYF04850.1 Hypothetical protein CAP_3876 [Chondromyces apiculatus DSM 436]
MSGQGPERAGDRWAGAEGEVKLARLGDLARVGLPEVDDAARDAAGQERLVAAVVRGAGREEGRRRAITRGATVLAAAAAIAAAVAVVWWPSPIDYAVENGTTTAEGYVAAPAGGEARVRFTEGSVVVLAAGASMRVGERGREGARVALEGGRASFEIMRRTGARWSVEVGPFVIEVTGTAFDVRWSREAGELVVQLREGAVVVRGPVAPEGVSMRAGQRLVARLQEGALEIQSGEAARMDDLGAGVGVEGARAATAGAVEGGAAGKDANAQGTGAEGAGPEGTEGAGAEANAQGTGAEGAGAGAGAEKGGAEGAVGGAAKGHEVARSWSKRVAEGDFGGVLMDAETRGIQSVLAQGSIDDLSALADAARYTGRSELARKALLAMRKRFAASSSGRAAAFLLGRMADGFAPAEAITWYDTYLAESPGGAFAAEALGRKMVATQRTGGRAAARPIAERYLARYPRGGHAAAARALLEP